jgi:hypothetical protein
MSDFISRLQSSLFRAYLVQVLGHRGIAGAGPLV